MYGYFLLFKTRLFRLSVPLNNHESGYGYKDLTLKIPCETYQLKTPAIEPSNQGGRVDSLSSTNRKSTFLDGYLSSSHTHIPIV